MSITITLTAEQLAAIAAQQAGGSPAETVPTPVVPDGFVRMPRTGHILPLPKPGENFWSYVVTNYAAAGGHPGEQGILRVNRALADQAAAEGRQAGELGQDSWPEALDRMYSTAYESAAQRAKRERDEAAAANAKWVSDPVRQPDPAPAGTETL